VLEWIKVIGPLILSWPIVVLVLSLVFRRHLVTLLGRFAGAAGSKAELGPLKLEFGQIVADSKEAVGNVNKLTELMAQSRLLELEITAENFSAVFTVEQRNRMQQHIEHLRDLTGVGS